MRWLTPRLGTAAASDPEVARVPDAIVVDVRDLVDREGNAVDDVRAKILEGAAVLGRDKRVIVCCDYGLSRSNAVATGILAASSGITVDEAVAQLAQKIPLDEVKLDVLAVVRQALSEGRRDADGSRTVAVTGSAGFLGSRVSMALRESSCVLPLTRQAVDLAHGAIALETVVRNHHVGTVLHLAHPRIVTTSASLAEAVTMMKTVIDACVVVKARLVYVSGWEVFSGYGVSHLAADESLPIRPASVYGQAKALCETLVQYAEQTRGLRACIVRPGPTFGEGSTRPRFVRAFVRHALRREPIVTHIYNNGRPSLDLLHVDDVVDALQRVATRDITGVMHFGSGKPVETRKVAEIVRDSLGAHVSIEERAIDANVTNVRMDSTRAGAALGWRPKKDVPTELAALARHIATCQDSDTP